MRNGRGKSKKTRDPLPEHFGSLEEAAVFPPDGDVRITVQDALHKRRSAATAGQQENRLLHILLRSVATVEQRGQELIAAAEPTAGEPSSKRRQAGWKRALAPRPRQGTHNRAARAAKD